MSFKAALSDLWQRTRAAGWARSPWMVVLGIGLVVAIRLWAVAGMSVTAQGWNFMDDVLYLERAKALIDGKWLGQPFDNLTLAKGPFYPMFIAGAFRAGVPLLVAEQLLYLGCCALLPIALSPWLSSRPARFGLFAILAFNPMSAATDPATRVVREGIYPALTVAVLATASGCLARVSVRRANQVAWAIGFGLALSAFWLTREEGAWLVPSLVVLLPIPLLLRPQGEPVRWSALLRAAAACGAAVSLAIGAVVVANGLYYGSFTTSDLKAPEFTSAMRALGRLGAIPSTVSVPRVAREQAYAASPAFARLGPYLEGDVGEHWRATGSCTDPAVRDCSDIGDAWLGWAVRDAAAEAGCYAAGASSAAECYARIAAEIDAACAAGRLHCAGSGSWPLPPWSRIRGASLTSTFVHAVAFVASFDGFQPRSGRTVYGAPWLMPLFSRLTGENVAPSGSPVRISGRAESAAPPVSFKVVGPPGINSQITLQRQMRPSAVTWAAVSNHWSKAFEPGFAIEAACPDECTLLVMDEGGALAAIPLDGTVRSAERNGLRVHLERFDPLPEPDASRRALLSRIGRGYGAATPVLLAAAMVSFFATVFRSVKRRRFPAILFIEGALLVAIATRLAIVSLFEATSFHALTVLYASPVYPLLLAFVVLALAAAPGIGNSESERRPREATMTRALR